MMFWKSQQHIKCNFICVCLEKLGTISYELFLIHGVIIYQFPKAFSGNSVLDLGLFILTSLFLSWLLHILVQAFFKLMRQHENY